MSIVSQDCAVLDLLISLSDFLSFKQQMLLVKDSIQLQSTIAVRRATQA